MAQFLIDANLPYYFSLWRGEEYVHVRDLNERWTDQQIWEYARQNDMVIYRHCQGQDCPLLATIEPPVSRLDQPGARRSRESGRATQNQTSYRGSPWRLLHAPGGGPRNGEISHAPV